MILGKLLFLLFVNVAFIAVGISVGYILVNWIAKAVAAHKVQRIKNQEAKKFENLFK